MKSLEGRSPRTAIFWGLVWGVLSAFTTSAYAQRYPDVVIVTVDTLRADRLSCYGYERPTTPALDALLERGALFTQARVPEPLTSPSMCSMLTSLYPHEHGSSRNGLRMRPGLDSLAKILQNRGYRTAAFVGNWTLRDKLSGLGEHFMSYHEIFSRKRWLGLLFGEATAEDLTAEAVAWANRHRDTRKPFLLWVHYVEPHAPYRWQEEYAARLGISNRKDPTPSDRYDSEIAFVDEAIGELMREIRSVSQNTLFFFAGDHGESLGEHGYWGHGRNLYEVTLRIPMGIVWEGRIRPQKISAPAVLLDMAPTLLGLLNLPVPEIFRGYDWSGALRGEKKAPVERITRYQAHKGATHGRTESARRKGLLAAGLIVDGRKEVFRLKKSTHQVFDLEGARESEDRDPSLNGPSQDMIRWLKEIQRGLDLADEISPQDLDEESVEQLRALGYIE